MRTKINLKNNKGISLASVVVTLILAMIILTSIIYSNNRTKEIQKAMLLNSDIEELTKKVEVYYLDKGILPIVEDVSSNYKYPKGVVGDANTPIYYKLDISLLENITLNNKEEINGGIEPNEGDQWYVINKETHTIYFVKCINGQVVPQIAQYSNKYESITLGATEDGSNRIIYNYSDSAGNGSAGNTTITPGIDELIEDTSSIDLGIVTPEGVTGTSGNVYDDITGAGSVSGSNGKYPGYGPYGYVGYENRINQGDIVLHYDGIYNDIGTDGILKHTNSTTRWLDLSGNNYHGTIVKDGGWKWEYSSTDSNYALTSFKQTTSRQTGTGDFNTGNSLKLQNNDYVLYDFYNYDDSNGNVTAKDSDIKIPDGSEENTIEIVFKYDSNNAKTRKEAGLFGLGTYGNPTVKTTNTEYNNFKARYLYKYVGRSVYKNLIIFGNIYQPSFFYDNRRTTDVVDNTWHFKTGNDGNRKYNFENDSDKRSIYI